MQHLVSRAAVLKCQRAAEQQVHLQANLTNYCSRFNGSQGDNVASSVQFTGMFRWGPCTAGPCCSVGRRSIPGAPAFKPACTVTAIRAWRVPHKQLP